MQQARWGRVIHISSLAATMPPLTAPDYSACKAAINDMTASSMDAIAFLASPLAGYITGVNLRVDGGLSPGR
ncbi:SDR family NAD(P)-dependent oxidoreductase [Paraburkholderia fynbosensis]|uniref:SDR family NAD(P)-dependent oxidoreductase n=1 Tax=Paraburkholderia fynbosensis TaxID=1200993 RepID=UPI00248413A2|nr:SDR family NAD(P)-dependent oxidoreductase [Paraburkholderia fynbosensis]